MVNTKVIVIALEFLATKLTSGLMLFTNFKFQSGISSNSSEFAQKTKTKAENGYFRISFVAAKLAALKFKYSAKRFKWVKIRNPESVQFYVCSDYALAKVYGDKLCSDFSSNLHSKHLLASQASKEFLVASGYAMLDTPVCI